MALQSSIMYSLAISFIILSIRGAHGQINSPCTASMLSTFNPCMSFLTSGSNITQPPLGCCNSISSLMGNGTDCFCQIATGNIFFSIPINRTLAFSLPRACNMPNVTLQCKTSGSGSRAPAPSPGVSPSANPSVPVPASAPGVDSIPAIPPSITSEGPTSDTESPPPPQTPASTAAATSFIGFSPLIVLAMFGVMF